MGRGSRKNSKANKKRRRASKQNTLRLESPVDPPLSSLDASINAGAYDIAFDDGDDESGSTLNEIEKDYVENLLQQEDSNEAVGQLRKQLCNGARSYPETTSIHPDIQSRVLGDCNSVRHNSPKVAATDCESDSTSTEQEETCKSLSTNLMSTAEEEVRGCGIPGIIPWWENAGACEPESDSEATELDTRFKSVLTGSFLHLSAESKRALNHHWQASKRRRRSVPRHNPTSCEVPAANPAQCMTANKQSKRAKGHKQRLQQGQNGMFHKCSGEEAVQNYGKASPVPDSNVGSILLRKLGWSPGTGLGAARDGIQEPVRADRRPGRQGLGYERECIPLSLSAAATSGHADDQAAAAASSARLVPCAMPYP